VTDRKTQLRANAARLRQARRAAGLEPHEVWVTRADWDARIKPILAEIAAARKDAAPRHK
jgi:hypothetical protein